MMTRVTRDNEASNRVPELLTGRIFSRTPLNHSSNHNDFLDMTVPVPEQNIPVAVQDLINRLADVLTNLQSRLAASAATTHDQSRQHYQYDV